MSEQPAPQQEEMIELKVKLPKSLVEFLRATKVFSRTENTIEDMCSRELTNAIVDIIRGGHLDEVLPELDPAGIIEAYKLERFDDRKGPE